MTHRDRTFGWLKLLLLPALLIFLASVAARAQTTPTTFTYQGRLQESGVPVTGARDFEFKLYDGAGAQVGATVTVDDVSVEGGAFIVYLDFGNVFNGTVRQLEIGVRPGASTGAFTALSPRQPITSSPYSIQTINAEKLGGADASQYVKTDDPRLGGPGGSFIQNTTTQQPAANFNIAGNGFIGGQVGIGTQTPGVGLRLDVNGITRMTSGGTGGAIQFGTPNTESGLTISGGSGGRADLRFDGSTVKLVAGAAGGPPGNASGIAINTSGNVGIGTLNPQGKLDLAGNAVQDRSSGGFIKVMLSVAADGTISRCYNGVTGSSSGNCGFTVTAGANGTYTVNLGFQVTDRFLSVSARGINGQIGLPPTPMSADFRFSTLPNANPNEVIIDTFRPDTGATANNPFMLIVH